MTQGVPEDRAESAEWEALKATHPIRTLLVALDDSATVRRVQAKRRQAHRWLMAGLLLEVVHVAMRAWLGRDWLGDGPLFGLVLVALFLSAGRYCWAAGYLAGRSEAR